MLLTLGIVGWNQFPENIGLPMEGVVFLLAVGGVPASIAMVVGLWRGVQKKNELRATASVPICSTGIRIAMIGLVLLLLGVTFLVEDCVRKHANQKQWVSEAQVKIEQALRSDRVPHDMGERLGPFKHFTGQGFGGAVWNIQGFDYLRARREGHFGNATIPVLFIVSEGRKTNAGNRDIVVMDVQVSTGKDAQLIIMVSHPDLQKASFDLRP